MLTTKKLNLVTSNPLVRRSVTLASVILDNTYGTLIVNIDFGVHEIKAIIHHLILKPKRKDTLVPQSSVPTDNIADEAVHKELGDRLGRYPLVLKDKFGSFDVGTLTGDEVFAEQEVAVKDVNLTVNEVTLAQALATLKSVNPKVKGDVIEEPKETAKRLQAEFDKEARLTREKAKKVLEANAALTEEWDDIQAKIKVDHELAQRLQAEKQKELSVEEKAKLFQQLLEQRRKHFATKRIEEKRNKPPTQAQQRKIIAFKRVDTFVDFRTDLVEGSSKRAGEELEQENSKKQKVEDDKEIAELKSLMEVILDEEEVEIDVVPLATKSLSIVDWKIYKEEKKSYYQIVRADGKSQMYRIFSQMLKSFTREDLEDLYKLVKAKYGSTRPVDDLDLLLWGDLKIMFEPHIEDQVWKNQQDYKLLDWKLYDSYRVHSLRMQHVYIHMLVEKKCLLIPSTITDMLTKKCQIDYESEMAYQLLKLLTKQLKNQ
ncbi:hypothetical protein Tco_1343114 [Tanacetum coccineum]